MESSKRMADVRTIYNSTDIDHKLELLRRYNVRYVVVGDVERLWNTPENPAYYASSEGLAAFDSMLGQSLRLAFVSGTTRIYEVLEFPEIRPSPDAIHQPMSSAEAVLRWWLAFSLIAVAFAPVTWWMGKGLGKYRQALIRPVGLVVATFILWWPAALIGFPFQRETVVLGIVLGGGAAWTLFLKRSQAPTDEIRSLITFELLWLASFLGYVAFRSANPDIANTEKPMEIALLSSVVLSSDVPAPDPWYAGLPINYYYFGYQSIASLVHISGVQAALAFNLMLGSLFASAIAVASGLGASLAARARLDRRYAWLSGGLAAFFRGHCREPRDLHPTREIARRNHLSRLVERSRLAGEPDHRRHWRERQRLRS